MLQTQRKDQVSERARVALLGSFVADAACMGAHWLSAEQIAALLLVRCKLQGSTKNLAFSAFSATSEGKAAADSCRCAGVENISPSSWTRQQPRR